jgi:putative hydrolase of the HAD superfamily
VTARIRAVLLDVGETIVERISDRDAPLTELHPVLFPESGEALADLQRAGYRLAVVSNTDRTDDAALAEVLVRLGIRDRIDAVVTSVSAGCRKPDPAIYQRALDLLACPAGEAVMVGDDSPVDLAGAAALGLRTVLVQRPGGRPASGNEDAVIGSLAGLLPLLAGWAAG